MRISNQLRQLVRIAGGINLLVLLLSTAFIVFFAQSHTDHPEFTRKAITFLLANGVCWLVNLFILIIWLPLAIRWTSRRWVSFYLPSYLITFTLSIVLSNSGLHDILGDEPRHLTIAGPIFFIVSIDTVSLFAIELILSRYAQSEMKLQYANMKAENAELNMKSMQAMHEKLKNQLHPHFLFNSLSALKSLIRKDPVLAEDYLIKLADFLRFSISHNEQNIVAFEDELKFSLDYLNMQQTRFGQALMYKVEIPPAQLKGTGLPVFSLQLLLENAIKHNKLTREQPLCIVIRYIDHDWLLVENNMHEKLSMAEASGTGLKNLSDRYKLLQQDDLIIDHAGDFFRVYLKIIRE